MAERKITWCCTNTLLLLVACHLFAVSADTNPDDTAALAAIYKQWKKTPPSWRKGDPCANWVGVDCENSRVTSLKLSTLGLQGNLADVMSLSQLQVLDLSFNDGLGDSIPPSIENLTNLRILILAGCNLTGPIPSQLGNLGNLTFLALNNNKLTGTIPPSLGKLSELYWFDIAENMLTGPLPVSSASSPGLDMLLKTKHLQVGQPLVGVHFLQFTFSDSSAFSWNSVISTETSSQFSGEIPDTIGLVSKLEVLRLDRNSFSGSVPSSLGNLTHLYELNLAGNLLTGPIPDLTKMRNLNYVDLSYNSFDTSTAPSWFTSLHNLTTLTMESAMLVGEVPQPLFSLPLLQELKLKNNLFNETLDMGDSISPQLQLVDLEYNQIHEVTLWNSYGNTLLLAGNPVCSEVGNRYCLRPNSQAKPYSTRVANCTGALCPQDRMQNPQSCECAYPYQGILQFRAPRFSDLTNSTPFQALERNLWTQFGLTPGSVLLHNLHFDEGDYMLLDMTLFPSNDTYFNMSVVFEIGFQLNNHTFSQPPVFGPYVFLYPFPEPNGRDLRSGEIIGIATGSTVLVLALIAVSIYAIRQKKRAEKAKIESQPFGSWGGARGKDLGEAPQLKGSRWFSYEEVKKCTSNFSARNEIGSGGYGKVYRGVLPSGQLVAIKRAQQGSMQGGAEFKTEVELLSRVHHKNLVSLVGFCFDRDEQMLVYEFVPNGTLRDSLTGRSGIYIDWKRRLRITLGSARGLAYLHELADPPIIHRDVKSTNILLDESLTAKVADFGLSKLVSDSAKGHISTQVKGTLGYLDPDYYMTQQLSEKSDVYSFGVVMLELITGRPPIERGRYIVREVRVAIDKSKELYGLRGLLDPAIRKSMLVGFERFVDLAMSCVEEFAADRPSMAEVVKEIETILKNEGLNTDPASASTSAADFGVNNTPRHPYDEALSSKENSDAFSNSGGYALPTNVEPK